MINYFDFLSFVLYISLIISLINEPILLPFTSSFFHVERSMSPVKISLIGWFYHDIFTAENSNIANEEN